MANSGTDKDGSWQLIKNYIHFFSNNKKERYFKSSICLSGFRCKHATMAPKLAVRITLKFIRRSVSKIRMFTASL